jgi:phage major head subunit gpT-like protein
MGYSFLNSNDIVADFYPRYEQELTGNWATQVGLMVSADLETENYRFLGQAAGMREWLGGRHEQILNRFTYTLTNKKYEDTLAIPVDDLRRDKTGQLRIRVGDMAKKAATHWNSLLSTLVTTNGNAYDGVAFYASTHAESGTSQKNLLTASEVGTLDITTATAPTATEFANALVGVIGWFYNLTDDQGDPANGEAKNFLVQVGTPALWGPALQAITLNNLTNGSVTISNPLFGMIQGQGINVQVQLNPRLSAVTSSFYVHRTDGAIKPSSSRSEVDLQTQLIGEGSEEEFKNDRHLFGLKAVRTVGYGDWKQSIKATFS